MISKIFISYAREDIEIAQKLCDDLKEKGLIVWIGTENILPGQDWKSEIIKAINDCNYFIALISSNSVSKKGFVQKELKIALDILDECLEFETFIIPVRLENCEPINNNLKKTCHPFGVLIKYVYPVSIIITPLRG